MPHAIEVPERGLQFADLPRELVGEILSLTPTRSLAAAARTSKFIHDIASYILAQRLRCALELDGYQLIYECYTADDQSNHPYNHCEYNGTHAGTHGEKLKSRHANEAFEPLTTLYTHFTPTPLDLCPKVPPEPAWSHVAIDAGDLFTQVCASANLVRTGTRGDRSVIPVFRSFFRVRRDWLDSACDAGGANGGDGVVWVGMGENVGLKLRVGDRQVNGTCRDDEPAVQYRVEYQSLVIRATYLLEAIEKRKHASYIQTISFTSQTVDLPALEPAVLVY